MNPLFRQAAAAVSPDAGVLMGVVTALFLALFLAWTWYAYAPSRAARMEAFGRIPFDDESEG